MFVRFRAAEASPLVPHCTVMYPCPLTSLLYAVTLCRVNPLRRTTVVAALLHVFMEHVCRTRKNYLLIQRKRRLVNRVCVHVAEQCQFAFISMPFFKCIL